MNFRVYFTVNGKKLKMDVECDSTYLAKVAVKDKFDNAEIIEVVLMKIKEQPIHVAKDELDYLKNIMGIK
jgi:hypothetical protein